MQNETQMAVHGSGRSGGGLGLGLARWRGPSERRAKAGARNAGQRLKGGCVLCGDKALALPVIDGLLGDAQ